MANILMKCSKCGKEMDQDGFLRTRNPLYNLKRFPICNGCLIKYVESIGKDWNQVNKVCQILDIPFVPAEWEKLFENNGGRAIIVYAKMFYEREYEAFDWKIYEDEYRRLQKEGLIRQTIPSLNDNEINELREKWGTNYDIDDLRYLEELYNGVLASQNINGALQYDQAKKLCKISLDIDSKLRAGTEFDKMLGSYEKLVKIANFNTKNVKNANDFESIGEIFAYLEKTGWVNKFYDGAKRDIVDETINNIQNFCQRLYTNESGIGDDITERMRALKNVKEIEDSFDTVKEIDYDMYSNEIIENLKEVEEFNADID